MRRNSPELIKTKDFLRQDRSRICKPHETSLNRSKNSVNEVSIGMWKTYLDSNLSVK
jgi:hypothetical protein